MHVMAVGVTGHGKTTLVAKDLIPNQLKGRVIVIDPLCQEIWPKECVTFMTPLQAKNLINAYGKSGGKLTRPLKNVGCNLG